MLIKRKEVIKMKNGYNEISDEALDKVVGGTREEYDEIVALLKKYNMLVYDRDGKIDFVGSVNKAMAQDPLNAKSQFHLERAVLSDTNPNEYHFYLKGFGDLGADGQGTLVAMLKGFFED